MPVFGPTRAALAAAAARGADILPSLRLVLTAEALTAPPPSRALELNAELDVLCAAVRELVDCRAGWLYFCPAYAPLPAAVPRALLQGTVLTFLRGVLRSERRAAVRLAAQQGAAVLALQGGDPARMPGDLPALLQLMQDEGANKFYFSHLNYAGRGNIHRDKDAHHQATRAAMDLLFDHAWAAAQAGSLDDYVSGNNDADGPYLLQWVRQHLPQWEEALRQRLVAWGGNASGQMVANIDNLGHVHPDTMWWHHDLGSVRARPFSQIWNDTSDPLMAGLKQRPRPVQGRCASCQYLSICNGNTRVRAQQLTGNPWFEDPGCYLSDAEVGAASTPFETPASKHARRTIEIAHV